MWIELPTVASCAQCSPPYSFFFDLVGAHWKSTNSDPITLHRICTLARKQGARFVAVESALSREDVKEEINTLDQHLGGGGASEAVAISFFATPSDPSLQIEGVKDEELLGQLILINYRAPKETDFTDSYIYEAILRPPTYQSDNGRRNNLLNNFISADGEFSRRALGKDFLLRGIYYAQQNSETHVCAHACLRMALNSIGVCDPPITNNEVNDRLGESPPFLRGLESGAIADFIDTIDGVRASVAEYKDLTYENFLTVLAAIVESGHVALLIFSTNSNGYEAAEAEPKKVTNDGQEENKDEVVKTKQDEAEVYHVVTVFGYTRNSDEWHPEALLAYSGPESSQYYPASLWIDHYLIHDDNLGPYLALSSRALDVDDKVKAHSIIALHPIRPAERPDYAEGTAATLLTNWLPSLATIGRGRWFEMMTRQQQRYVLRTLLVRKEAYLKHLESAGHDESRLTTDEINNLAAILPEWFWMVEFSLPQLYTGNRSKLGEVLIDALKPADSDDDPNATLLAIRLPSLLVGRHPDGAFAFSNLSTTSHVPIYQHRGHDHVW